MRKKPRRNLLDSFRNAGSGLLFIIEYERNARIHLVAALVVILMGFWLGLGRIEWALIIAAIGLVFAGEMLNTVVELTIDLICPGPHVLAKHAKDVAAGAILVSAVIAMLIGLLILGPPLLQRVGLQ